jgi:hypothetical protein
VNTIERDKGQEKGGVIRLDCSAAGTVLVTTDDEDRFFLTAQHAVKACQDYHRRTEASKNFKAFFIVPLYEWCNAHARQVSACYIPFPETHIQVFVIGTSKEYDFELGKEVSALELRLAKEGWRINILQLPLSGQEDLQAYFDIDGALQVYAQIQRA